MAGDTELAVWIEADKDKGTLSIRDNGIGMSREEAISHLGTIARSGTAEFFKKLSGDQQKDSQLIGQFGVGFYSAFIVAERVEVLTPPRRACPPARACAGNRRPTASSPSRPWSAPSAAPPSCCTSRRTRRSSSTAWRLRSLVRRYSDHIAFPVRMPKEGAATLEYEAVNRGTALWARPKSEIKDEEYVEFYRHLTHDSGEPLTWSHNRVEGKRDYTSLIYIPAAAPFDLWQRDGARGLKLYVRRVFIMDDAEQFLPLYLRFVKGVLDSADLPLNVSRELLQADSEVEAMRGALTRRVLELLAKLAKDEPAKYQGFWTRVRRGAQGRPGRGSRQSRQAAAAAAVRLHAPRRRRGRQCRWPTTWRACRPARTRSTTWSARAWPRRAAIRPSRRCARATSRCCC